MKIYIIEYLDDVNKSKIGDIFYSKMNAEIYNQLIRIEGRITQVIERKVKDVKKD